MKRYTPKTKTVDCTGSSNLTAMSYDGDKRELTVSFKDGSTYKYEGVAFYEVLEIESADSKGSAFHRFTKAHKGEKVEG